MTAPPPRRSGPEEKVADLMAEDPPLPDAMLGDTGCDSDAIRLLGWIVDSGTGRN